MAPPTTTTSAGFTPVIVGVGEVRNKHAGLDAAAEPADLMLAAIRQALRDTASASGALVVDSIAVVQPWTWQYGDLPGLLAARLGAGAVAAGARLHMTEHGGNQPGLLCDEAARAIASGQSKAAIIVGGEALASLAAFQKVGKYPPPGWTEPDLSGIRIDLSDKSMLGDGPAGRHGMGLPVHVYPLYENGLRARLGQTYEQNSRDSAEMYAAFDAVACRHEYSWRAGEQPRSAQEIGTVTARNRIICSPYPLLMNAFNTVNLAAACVLTSVEHARELGIPEDKWVYVLGGAGTSDGSEFWLRNNFYSSPAISQSVDAALRVSGLERNEIDCFDFYSCFPIVPKIACQHLGLDPVRPNKPITLLGGLTSFGGAGNNYSMHALTEMTRQIRGGKVHNGLVLANGGSLSYQHVVCLSNKPRKAEPYPAQPPLPKLVHHVEAPEFVESAEGPATIETFTVEFGRNGSPENGLIVGRLDKTGQRFLANHGDAATLARLADTSAQMVGVRGWVRHIESDGRNLLFIGMDAKI
ncbi:hypothetical protein HK405_008710 [Cladochytrium tenue]|nr:hypothetical protein HK405_008710 [Cladochytrium tenue]